MNIKNVKFSLFLLTSFLFINFSNAQKIKEEDGLVTLDGKPYVKIIKTKAWLVYNNFTIQNLSGVDLATFKYRTKTSQKWDDNKGKYVEESTIYYTVDFTGSGAHANIYEQLGYKMVIKILLKNNLIKDDAIDPIAERKYINKMYGSYPQAIPPYLSNSPIILEGDLITIDGKTLGKFIEKYSDTTKTTLVISIYDRIHNEKIAEAKAPSYEPVEWEVYTETDDKSSSILYTAPEAKEKLFKWLVSKQYLK
jgi:hypothetical protein